MPPRVLFVGRGFPRGDAPNTWGTMSVADLAAGRMRAMSQVVLVLGDRALEALDPRGVEDAGRATRTATVVAPTRAAAEVIATWARSYVGEVVSEPRLPQRVREIASRPLRARMEPSEWLPDGGDGVRSGADRSAHRGEGRSRTSAIGESSASADAPPRNPDAERLARVLTTLDVPRVETWAAAAGLSAHQLYRACVVGFGRSPRRLIECYIFAQIRAGRREGLTTAAIADSLGYSDAPTLLRVLRSAGSRLSSPPTVGDPRASRRSTVG